MVYFFNLLYIANAKIIILILKSHFFSIILPFYLQPPFTKKQQRPFFLKAQHPVFNLHPSRYPLQSFVFLSFSKQTNSQIRMTPLPIEVHPKKTKGFPLLSGLYKQLQSFKKHFNKIKKKAIYP
ncbi:hypothetical protein FLBR109950_08215 [Flavobacterium branchiophilum]